MTLQINWNDAWESVPLECVDAVIAYLNRSLQPSHPLRAYKLFPVAKCWKRERYLLEEDEPTDNLWILDLGTKRRIAGKTCFYFKRLETQQELDALLNKDLSWWIQYMKDAGAWHGD